LLSSQGGHTEHLPLRGLRDSRALFGDDMESAGCYLGADRQGEKIS
jgi:hypothetical protein